MATGGETEEIKCLFITGFPADLQQREIYTLFRFFDGFDGGSLKINPSGRPMCFARFTDTASAEAARNKVNNMQFDLQDPTTILKAEFARSNTKSTGKRDRNTEDVDASAATTHQKKNLNYHPHPQTYGAAHQGRRGIEAPQSGFAQWPSYYDSSAMGGMPGYGQFGPWGMMGGVTGGHHMGASTGAGAVSGAGDRSRSSGTAVKTLYVAGFGRTATDALIRQQMSGLPGFTRLKTNKLNTDQAAAFVEFTDHNTAAAAQALIRSPSVSSPFGDTLSVTFAKADMKIGQE